MRARLPTTIALLFALSGLAVWRAACLDAGPDIDTDAYAHHMIARAILADPRDLAVHWVWLPLFHYLQVPLVALGGTLQDVRWANVVLAAALPLVLFEYVARTARSSDAALPPEAVALVAALLAAMCPIAMQMGTTGQPEPLFALLILLVAIAFERRSFPLAAACLGAAVMLRYEGWAALATVAAVLAHDRLRKRERPLWPLAPSDWGEAAVVLLPAVLIVGWAALRRPVDGQWFGFLRQTHEFANDALHQKSAWDAGLWAVLRDVFYYPLVVPVRVLGAAMLPVPFGIVRTWRQQGARFVLVLLACLGFVSLTWVLRATLGLDRHFVCVVPLYATFAAQGIAAIADRAAPWLRRALRVREGGAVRAARALAGVLAIVALAGLATELAVWMGYWRTSIERGWPERAALGKYLRGLPGGAEVFCDDATLEILSGLDRRRFDRHWVDDPHTWSLIAEAARERGFVYVATWRRKLRGHEEGSGEAANAVAVTGDIVFRSGFDAQDADTTGLAVMRVPSVGRPSPR